MEIVSLDIDEVKNLVNALKPHKNLDVSNVMGSNNEIKTHLNRLIEIVKVWFKEPPGAYQHIYNIISSAYDNTNILPGTIGAYLWGCMNAERKNGASHDDGYPGCNVECAGSIPPPMENFGNGFCDRPVILVSGKSNGLRFTSLIPPGGISDAYLFVHEDLLNSLVFTDKDITNLKADGIKNISIYSYVNGKPNTQSKLINNIDIDNIPRRYRPNVTSLWTILFAVGIIVMIAILIYYMFFKK